MVETVKPFTPGAVATSHVAIALCVEEFSRSFDTDPHQTREAFAELLDGKFREVFEIDHGLSREDEHDLHRIWEAFRKLLRSPTLKKYEPPALTTQ